MSENKIYKKLPGVLQTTAIKNFFESTVEQLFSKANSEIISGFVGERNSENHKSGAAFLQEETATRQFYSLSPVVNTVNTATGDSENLIFFDELLDTLKTYGVDTKNQNKIFGENYYSYLPPINIDKILNYQEYFWSPEGPPSIQIQGTLANPIDVEQDIIGAVSYTLDSGVALKNGMIVRFVGDYVIPRAYLNTDYIIEGVGEQIRIVEKDDSFESFASTSYTELPDPADQYDSSTYSLSDSNVVFSAASISNVIVVNAGIGYVNPTVSFIGANDSPAAATVTLDSNGSVTLFTITGGGVEYSGPVGVILNDVSVTANVAVGDFASYGLNPVVSKEFILNTNTNIKVGQVVTGFVSGIVDTISSAFDSNANAWVHTLTLEDAQTFSYAEANTNPTLSFTGRDFLGEVRRNLMHTITSSNVNILDSQVVTGINPRTGEYYFRGGNYSFDKNLDPNNGGDDDPLTGDLAWGGSKNEIAPDYILIARGAKNKNVWSRTNFWFHKDNFIDAGAEVPENTRRAKRPIIEFHHNIELYNHGVQHIGAATIAATEYKKDQQYTQVSGSNVAVGGGVIGMMSGSTIDDVPVESAVLIFPNEELNVAKFVYLAYTDIEVGSPTFGKIKVRRLGHPTLNPSTLLDGDAGFVPWEVEVGDVIQITSGRFNIGNEYYWTEEGWKLAQQKISSNQAPLFNLYDDQGNYLGDDGIYPASNFAGNEIFSYKVSTIVNAPDDSILRFPLSYRSFKASSEIEFENDIISETVNYTPFGADNAQPISGYYFYKNVDTDLLETHWKPSAGNNKQRIVTTYNIDQYDVDEQQTVFYIGAIPNEKITANSGYDIIVTVNGAKREDFTYSENPLKVGFIRFDNFNFSLNDFIEISVLSDTGLISLETISKFELPLSWRQDPSNVVDIISISEPEFLPHFKNYMESQEGFQGNPLGSNNFSNTSKDSKHAKNIVYTDHNLVLGAFLLDDQPHNLVNSLRFNSAEYEKYKNRLKKEISNYYNSFSIENFSNEYVLERVLRNLISYRTGTNVFNRTYVVPFGDNYSEEVFVINDVTRTEFASNVDTDLDKIENSLLVYKKSNSGIKLLTIDKEYVITGYSPITIEITDEVTFVLGDQIIFKIYNENRDSAQCPPTPSVTGLYPLTRPEIIYDNTYETPIQVVLGHDGSRTPVFGDRRDEILLEFEKRVYNSAKAEFRDANSLPALNFTAVKKGAFRETGFANREWFDLLRFSFANWVSQYNLDFVKNEYFDDNDELSWNYRGKLDIPGHWRGWMEYYYDTYEPHRHPWEMLGFFEKPAWWDDQYGTDYSSMNMTMWNDLEEGIIRQGPRENVTNSKYLTNNPFRREGLHMIIPVDENGELKSPFNIISTGTTTKTQEWTNSRSTSAITSLGSSAYKANSFLTVNGLNVSYDSSNIYVEGRAIINHTITNNPNAVGHSEVMEQDISFVYPRTSAGAASNMPAKAVAVLVNGLPLYNPTDVNTWNNEGTWHYNKGKSESHSDLTYGHAGNDGVLHYYYVDPVILGLEKWDTANHSPIVGWAFDGLPIYGPYGYKNPLDSTSEIVNIKSPFRLRQGTRIGDLAGAHSGMFVEDYDLNAAVIGAQGYTDAYNTRYGYTPDSPSTPIRYYVATIDDDGNPMFPYAVGGGVKSHTGSNIVWGAKYVSGGVDLANNTLNSGTVNSSATNAIISVSTETREITGDTAAQWKFGDLSPVEYAWRSSPVYSFAVAEALLLAKPGLFAAEFSDPTNVLRPTANPLLLLNKVSRKRWDFASEADFRIHGTFDADDNFVTNIGYTQFINSWISFQGLDQTDDFAKKLRSLNVKLGHRMAGFIDEDTTVVRTDQYSTTGKATSLIIPKENITVQVHNSPYKTRNFYSGVIIEKTLTGYKVRGFDKNYGYFDTFETDKTKGRERIQVGGRPADFVAWDPGIPYKKDTIVQWQNGFYKAPKFINATTTFDSRQWKRLPSLPQVGGASATLYQAPTENIVRVDYETEFTSVDDLYDFLIGLGYYQQAQGYDLNDFDESINEVRNWSYAAKQFLFWTTGRWEVGNTLELSPLARKIAFEAPRGFISKINRTDREQFTILDQDGIAITPAECEILREDNRIEITPPEGKQIYGIVLFTKEIEHAITVDNTTIFNDVIFDTRFNQRHTRLKIKATRTKGWNGRLLTEGFIVNGSELLPNLDNMAESLGRYHELGFIPVEKSIYKAARGMFGFEERDYLKDLDISEDDQFEFYRGMIQNKGTSESLRKIAASNIVVQGNVAVYDEWALRVADFGDTDNNQSVELKLEKSEIVNDPQLITLAFPEDITGIVEKIDVIKRRYKYYGAPEIVISAPTTGTTRIQATATATLNASRELDSIAVTDQGAGYAIPVGVTIIAGNVVTGTVDTTFQRVTAISTGDWIATTGAELSGNIIITDHFGNSNVSVNLSNVTSAADIVTAINSSPGLGGNITAAAFRSDVTVGNSVVTKHTLTITGNDFSIVSAAANLHLTNGRYQPAQRYSVVGANTTVAGNITVTVDGVEVNQFVNGANSSSGYNWTFDEGDRWRHELQGQLGPSGSFTYTLGTGTEHSSSNIAAENNYVVDGEYKHLKLFINGFHTGYTDVEVPNQLLLANSAVAGSTEYQNVWEVNGSGNEITLYIDRLPNSVKYFSATSNNSWILPATNPNKVSDPKTLIKVVEDGTIQFTNNYQGDLPNSILNIVVKVQDGIAIKLGAGRSYEITPEIAGDDVILFDIDDAERFLKKPSGVREYNLWPTTRQINFTGIWDNAFLRIPNAGYVNPANVNFMSYSIADLPDLFSDNIIVKPAGGHLIHVAVSENKDWNVYKLEPIDSRISFLYQAQGTDSAKLVTNNSLFNYLDSNMIGEADTSRYLDYFLTLKNADVSDNVVVWTNERIIQQRQADITNPKAPRMIEARIKSIGPAPGSNIAIADYKPIATKIYADVQVSNASAANTLVLNFRNVHNIKENDAITLAATSGVQYYSNATVVLNSAGNVTFTSVNPLPSEFTAPAYVTLYTEDTNIYNKSVFVKSVNVAAGTFTVTNSYFANSNVLVGLGNIDYLLNVTPNYDAGNTDIYYLASNVTNRKLEISGPELANIVSGVQYNAVASNVFFNGNGNISIETFDFIPANFKVPGNITLYASGDSTANGNVYYVESINRRGGFIREEDMASPVATSLVVKDPYFSNANTTYSANANVTFISYGNITINSADAIPANFAVPGYVKLRIGPGGLTSSNNRPVYVTAANLTTNTFTVINDGLFTTANATANLNVVGYSLEVPSNTVSGLGNVSFTLTVPSTVEVQHMDRTKIITSAPHDVQLGQVVRIFSNAFTGTYTVRGTPDDRSIEIDAPFTYNDDRTGWLIKKGLQIKTTDPHGISPEYAKNRKRIAIHFADPRLYNDIYFIDEITPDSIIVKDRMPLEGIASVYLDRVQAYVRGANLSTRTVQITNNGLLSETTVIYTANSQLVPANAYAVNSTNIVFDANILDANTSVSTGFTIFREMDIAEDRYPILTTLDHGVVKLNGIDLSITSYNNLQGTVDSINREMNLRRAAISSRGNTMSVGFNMLSDINTELPVPSGTKNFIPSRQFNSSTVGNLPINSVANGSQLGTNTTASSFAPAYQISNYGPYVKDENTLISLTNRDAITGNLILSSGNETSIDPTFNKGPIRVGPLRGITYTDSMSGQRYLWNFEIGKYVRIQQPRAYTADPADEFSIGLDTLRSEISYNPDPAFADGTDTGASVNPEHEQDLIADPTEEDQDTTELPQQPPNHDDTAPILTVLAGNGPTSYIDPTAMGKKRPIYDLTATRGGNVSTSPNGADTAFSVFANPRWALKAVSTAAGWLIEVYENVKNNKTPFANYYWILVDKVMPPSFAHNFWGTINANSEFGEEPIETSYYYTDTEFTGNIDLQTDSVSANEAYYIDIPPVEPAFYVGKQLIPEPFAVSGGNNANAAVTWAKLPPSVIGASAPNLKDTKITVNATGYNSFLMWVPGLTPGKWDPQVEGPGHLDGFAGYPTFWGYGSGYYNDTGGGQSPTSFISGGTDPYPGAATEGWSTRQPRFKYSKNFTVFPLKNNDVNELANSVILDGQTNHDNPANTLVRADDIFVACFWTEAHTYKKQLVGYNYKNFDAEGNPAPIYKDYNGTVTRVKYIRISELPANAVLRRPIPDTGWGGKGWKNLVTDTVKLPGEYNPAPGDANNPWSTFDLTSLPSGSTGEDADDATPAPIGDPQVIAQGDQTTPLSGGRGLGRANNDLTFAAPLVNGKPVLTGGALESLPGPCQLSPVVIPPSTDLPCYNRPSQIYTTLRTELDGNALTNTGIVAAANISSNSATISKGLIIDSVRIASTNALVLANAYTYTPANGILTFSNSVLSANANVNTDFLVSGSIHEEHTVIVVGNNPFYVFFDFSSPDIVANGVTIEQSDDISFGKSNVTTADIKLVTTTMQTPISEGGISRINDGQQIGVYGVTNIPRFSTNLLPEVNSAFGIDNPVAIGETKRLKLERLEAIDRYGQYNGVKNIGFIAKTVDCRNGQYVRISVNKGSGNKTGKYKLLLIYTGVEEDPMDPNNGFLATCPDRAAPSRVYRGGARIEQFTYSDAKRKKRVSTTAGAAVGAAAGVGAAALGVTAGAAVGASIVGATVAAAIPVIGIGLAVGALLSGLFGKKKKGLGDGYFGGKNAADDNIYYPYGTGSNSSTHKTVNGVNANGKLSGKSVGIPIVDIPTVPNYSTYEFKGYYRAPVDGTYTFSTTSDDASYVWISPNDDKSDDEYYKDNGYQPGNPKNYTQQNAIVANGGLHGAVTKSGTIQLKAGGYYFVRGIFGNNKGPGSFAFRVKPPNTPEEPVKFTGRKCPTDDGYVDPATLAANDSALYNPAPGSTTNNAFPGGTGGTGGFSGGVGNFGINFDLNEYLRNLNNTNGNFSGYSQPEMTGHAYMPTSYKIRNTKKTIDPQSYGYSVALDSNRFVNATSQRVTGGFVIPLAKKLEIVSRTPRPLESSQVSSQPWFKTSQLNLNNTFRAVNYSPRRIGSTFMLDTMAAPITNVVNGMVVTNNNNAGGITLSPTGATVPGIGVSEKQVIAESSSGLTAATNNVTVETPLQEAPFENRQDKIKYTAFPTIDITPLVLDGNGTLVPAGAPAIARMVKPTPTASVSAQNLASIPQGSELVINGKTILTGTTAETFKAQINCADIGIRADINKATGNLVLRSCSDNPFNVQNGCGPGKLKQVADFHISRGFDQSRSVTAGESYTDRALNVYGVGDEEGLPIDTEWTQFDSDDELELVLPLGNSIIGARTTTATTTTNFSTGGSGYSVGDRLRLIGGTPVNNTQGPLTLMCIDDPGYGYTDAGNLRVVIGGNDAPGFGAEAIVTELDESGGIKFIEMVNWGIGYDSQTPPDVKIVDIGERFNGQYTTINAQDLASVAGSVYSRGTILLVQDSVEQNNTTTVREKFYRVAAANITVAATTYNASANAQFLSNSNISISGNVASVKANTWVTLLFAASNEYANAANNFNFYVSNVNVSNTFTGAGSFTVSDRFFANTTVANALNSGAIQYTVVEPLNYRGLVEICDPRLGRSSPMIHARIGIDPATADAGNAGDGTTDTAARTKVQMLDNFRSLNGPLRVAKFIVTGIDAEGSITALRIIDRGLYKVFPSDLTMGIPLEYDYEPIGQNSFPEQALGLVDPLRNNILYGGSHPEYQQPPFVNSDGSNINQNNKHPDWADLDEYRRVIDPTAFNGYRLVNGQRVDDPLAFNEGGIGYRYELFNGTPGGYDPLTFVYIGGQFLSKQQIINTNPADIDFGNYFEPRAIAGGSGARLFLTASEVPDCSEKGTAKEALGLPDTVADVNAPEVVALQMNNALAAAGYKPTDISVDVLPIGIGIDQIDIKSPGFPGVRIGGTPGFAEKLGIPVGDYFNGMLCIEATLSTPNLTGQQATAQLEELYKNSAFGLLTPEQDAANYGPEGYNTVEPPQVLSLLCVNTIQSDPNSWFGNFNKFKLKPPVEGADTGLGLPGDIEFINELYEYDIQTIFGENVNLIGNTNRQSTNVFVFESKRFLNVDLVEEVDATDTSNISLATEPKVWIDSYFNTDPANVTMTGFDDGGWAYLEYGVPKRWQTPLTNPNFVKNVILYNQDDGAKITDFEFWDPFKGIIPGFVRNEIHFVGTSDPVNYNNARTNFGQNNVGKVWWDTSTLRYMWYEQGSDIERWKNWGRTFPGSTVTVCEWVESRALPQNWTGDGTPRWLDRYVTERRYDEVNEKYENFYYYWVQNRSKLDPRLVEQLGRKHDVETLAKFIANPSGYGLNLVSFVSENSFVLNNIGQILPEDSGVIQINLSRNLNADGIKHTAWKLMREGDNNSIVPEHLSDKLIDSLCGEDAVGEFVPDRRLSNVESYGISFRPRQTMFVDMWEARRVMTYMLNEILADIKLNSIYPNWDANLVPSNVFEYVTWYEVKYIDQSTNTKVRYDSSYKPIYNVSSISELKSNLNVPDGTVLQVKGSTGDQAQLWIFDYESQSYKLIAIENETIKIKNSVYNSSSFPETAPSDLRSLLIALRDNVFNNTQYWNMLFFALMKYAYMEQGELSWAFKTSYVYVEKDEEDLIEFVGFKPENFEKVIEYMNEVKPFTAKIREYKDGKRAPMELIGAGMISDFDKPPYPDPLTGNIRILDDFVLDDANILANDDRYINYNSILDKNAAPFRRSTTTIVFDRTNWEMTQTGFNANTTTINRSIARNIANLTLQSNAEVSANVNTRAVDRIFKFDPEVQTMFVEEINAHYGNTSAGSDANITTNANILTNIIDAGNLSLTLALVKDKVGGNFRGDVLDANVFTKAVFGLDGTTDYLDVFAWDTAAWDSFEWDERIDVINYQGIFSESVQGNITFRRNNTTYEGFDGVTFKRVLYGEERPEEMVMLSPLESMIMRVTTNIYPSGNNLTISNVTTTLVSFDAAGSPYDATSLANYDYSGNITLSSNGIVSVGSSNVFFVNATMSNATVTFPADRDSTFPALVQLFANGNLIIPEGTSTNTLYIPSANANTFFYVSNVTANAITGAGTFTIEDDYFTSANAAALANANVQYRIGVYTSVDLFDEAVTNATVVSANTASANASNVQYQIHQNLFGQTEYLRILENNKTTLAANVLSYSTEITVVDSSGFADPRPQVPGVLWLGSEKVLYERKTGNTFGGLTRGAAGTAIQNWVVTDITGAPITIDVFPGNSEEMFNDLNPESNVWLDIGASSLADLGNADVSNVTSIMKFLHNL